MIEGAEFLLDHDLEFLKRKGWRCTISRQADAIDVIVHDYPLPQKYSPRAIDLLVKALPGYPNVGMDMFWTHPQVTLSGGGVPAAADHFQNFQNRSWQRWSRHGTWRADIDNFETFFAAILREFAK